jgi:drug/metabolite transporter (DMT)-like permease
VKGPGVLTTAHGTHRGAFAAIDWALFLTVSAIWGSVFLFIAIALEAFRPGLVTWLRVLFGTAVLWSLPGARTRIDRKDWTRIVALSILWVALPFTLFPLAQRSVNSAIAGMLNGAAPIFTAVTGSLMLRQAPGPRQLVGIPIGFLGAATIALSAASAGPSQLHGVIMIIGATLCYGTALNIATPLQQRYGSFSVTARILPIAAVLTTPFGLASLPGSRLAWPAIAATVVLGFFGTGVAFVLMGRLVGRVGSTRASTINYLVPVVALGLGVVFRDDHVRPAAVVGVVLAILGAYVASRRERRSV